MNFAPQQFLYNSEAISLLDSFKLAKKTRQAIDETLEKDNFQKATTSTF